MHFTKALALIAGLSSVQAFLYQAYGDDTFGALARRDAEVDDILYDDLYARDIDTEDYYYLLGRRDGLKEAGLARRGYEDEPTYRRTGDLSNVVSPRPQRSTEIAVHNLERQADRTNRGGSSFSDRVNGGGGGSFRNRVQSDTLRRIGRTL